MKLIELIGSYQTSQQNEHHPQGNTEQSGQNYGMQPLSGVAKGQQKCNLHCAADQKQHRQDQSDPRVGFGKAMLTEQPPFIDHIDNLVTGLN